MKRKLSRVLHVTLVAFLVTTISVSPATAGWLLENIGGGGRGDCCALGTTTMHGQGTCDSHRSRSGLPDARTDD